MSIWKVTDCAQRIEEVKRMLKLSSRHSGSVCPLCKIATFTQFLHKPHYTGKEEWSAWDHIGEEEDLDEDREVRTWTDDHIWVCATCGWWRVVRLTDSMRLQTSNRSYRGATGALRQLSDVDISPVVAEARLYLLKHGQSGIGLTDPYILEDVVASVMREMGYRAVATARTHDHGIDVVAEGGDGNLIGVQVKQTKRTISIEQIHSFIGALIIGDMTKGVYVTTSHYSKQAEQGVTTLSARSNHNIECIELVDGPQFLSALECSQVDMYTSGEQLAEYYENHLVLVQDQLSLESDADLEIENSILA
jgi:hypothetical protein